MRGGTYSTFNDDAGEVVDVPVTWKGNYDPNTPGIYTLTAEFSGYTYAKAHPYAVVTVEESKTASQPSQNLAAGTVKPELTEDTAYLAEFKVEKIVDGTADFDTSDDPNNMYYKNAVGNDENDHNGIVRSFDNITYDLTYRTEVREAGDLYEKGTICFEFIVPLNSEQAKWDTEAMSWMDPGSYTVKTEEVTYDFNGDGQAETVSCQVLRGEKTLEKTVTNPTAISGSGTLQAILNVLAAPNNTEVKPVFSAWLKPNDVGEGIITGNNHNCAAHGTREAVTAEAAPTRVTAEPRYNVRLAKGDDSYTAIGTYDFDIGNELALDKGNGKVTGRATAYGVTLQLYNHAGRGLKGVEYPSGPITFDLELSTKFVPTAGNPALTEEQQAEIMQNYTPLVLSYGRNNNTNIDDGRNLSELGLIYAVGAAPGNSGMTEAHVKKGTGVCYKGGNWNATKTGNVISVTVSDYQIKYPLFPNTNLGNAPTGNIYYPYQDGVQNIGCFSAGKFFIVTPFYNNGTTDPSKKGTYILEDYGLSDGNFYTTVKDVKLRATSVTGQSLKETEDNSNQEKTTDDSATATIYLSRPGSFTYLVAWSQGAYADNHHYDVLRRDDQKAGHWCYTGQDVLMKGSPVTIGGGFVNSENGDGRNRMYAADILCKFDGSAVTLTGKTSVYSQVLSSGWNVEFLFAAKPDGTNWTSDDEMNKAEIEDLCYYASLEDVPKGYTVVAYLAEFRPKDNDPSNIKKIVEGVRAPIQVGAVVNNDDTLVGNVYQCVIGGKAWRVSEYEAADGNIPSMLGNDPSNPVQLPNPTITDYRTYEKAYYDETGYAGGHTGSQNYGDSLLIVETLPKIVKKVEQQEAGANKQIYQMDSDQRYVDYALTPSFTEMPDGLSATTTLTITDTLGKGLTYVPGSSYIGGTYIQNEKQGQMGKVEGGTAMEPEVTQDGDKTVLTWVLPNVKTDEEQPVIHFSAVIGTKGVENTDVQHNDTLNNTVTIKSTGDMRKPALTTGNMASVDIRVAKLIKTALSKIAEAQWYEPSDYMKFTLNVGNNGANGIKDAVIVDTLPYNGDSRGSSFTGPFTVKEIELSGAHVSNLDSWRCFYTMSPAARETISSDYQAADILAGSSTVEGGTVTWTEATVDSRNFVPDLADKTPTAIAWIGDLNAGETFQVFATFQAPESKPGDVLVNGLSRGDDNTISRVNTVARSLSGLPWLDSNEDGQRDGDEVNLAGIKVQLLKKDDFGKYMPVEDIDGNPIYVETALNNADASKEYTIESLNNKDNFVDVVLTATAKADGSYEFYGLPAGEYGARFVSGTNSLGKYIASPVDQGSDYTDSDGVPKYSDGGNTATLSNQLEQTEILGIAMPKSEEMASAFYTSRFHDSGFYYKQGSVTIQKNGEDGKGLAGVVFRLEKMNAEGAWEEVAVKNNTTDSSGVLKYEGLYPGEYKLTEVSTVEGNSLLAEPVYITIPYTNEDTEGTPSYVENGKDYYLDLTYTIQNNQVFVVPTAGGFDSKQYLLLGAGIAVLAIIGIGVVWSMKRRNRLNKIRRAILLR